VSFKPERGKIRPGHPPVPRHRGKGTPRWILRSLILATVTLCSSPGCADPAPDSFPVTRDSAGITIVENGPLSDEIAFEVGPALYQVGWKEGEPQFGEIRSAALLPGGRAAVEDAISNRVTVLTRTGSVDTVWGGGGAGPNEIGHLVSLWHLGGDTVLVEDDGNRRMTVFQDGAALRSSRIEYGGNVTGFNGIGLQGPRTLIMTQFWWPLHFQEPWLQAPIVRYDLDTGGFDTLRTYDFQRRVPTDREANPFRPVGHAAVTAGGLAVTRGDRPEAELLDADGTTTHLIRWVEERTAVPDSAWAVLEGEVRARSGGGSEERLNERNERLREARRAAAEEPLPYSGGLHGDRFGNLWVAAFSTDRLHISHYRAFSPVGVWLGWVHMPPRFQLLDIGRDHVLGIRRDTLDVEAVALYPLYRR